MRILYIANHDQSNNDDEGAITDALSRLGHDVQRLHEKKGHLAHRIKADFLLFHKWDDPETLAKLDMPKAYWYFDLVDWPTDDSLAPRCAARKAWMQRITPLVDIGFCTDGDWVRKDTTGKLRWLTQGCDQRVKEYGTPPFVYKDTELLFLGISKGGGWGRTEFVDRMSIKYGVKFRHIPKGLYGRDLHDQILKTKIVVSPPTPVTDYYWSNRVYVTLSHGALLLHPHSLGLSEQFQDNEHLKYYYSMSDLDSWIQYYWKRRDRRDELAAQGMAQAHANHSYIQRCEMLMNIVEKEMQV